MMRLVRFELSFMCRGGTVSEILGPEIGESQNLGHSDHLTVTTMLDVWLAPLEASAILTQLLTPFTDEDVEYRREWSAPAFVPGAHFEMVTAEHMVVTIPGPSPVVRRVGLTARQRWFLELTRSLALTIHSGDQRWFGVISNRVDTPDYPMMAYVPGSFNQARRLVEYSLKWQAGRTLPLSNMLGSQDEPSNAWTWERFCITPGERSVPRTKVEPGCRLCSATGRSSSEHCTPRWIMDRMGLVPITAPILCVSCNNRLGVELEAPFRAIYDAQAHFSNPEVTARWAFKTAVMLALAGAVQVPDGLTAAVAASSAAERSVQIFVHEHATPLDQFAFALTYFGAECKRRAAFVCSFGFDRLMFLVVQWPDRSLAAMPYMRRISPHPSRVVPSYGHATGDGLHPDVLFLLSGERSMETAEAIPSRVTAPRTPS